MILLMKRFTLFSAGVGRTGTFIAIMVEMARIKLEEMVDIYNFVRYMRTRRPMMVMNEVIVISFSLCYNVIAIIIS